MNMKTNGFHYLRFDRAIADFFVNPFITTFFFQMGTAGFILISYEGSDVNKTRFNVIISSMPYTNGKVIKCTIEAGSEMDKKNETAFKVNTNVTDAKI